MFVNSELKMITQRNLIFYQAKNSSFGSKTKKSSDDLEIMYPTTI